MIRTAALILSLLLALPPRAFASPHDDDDAPAGLPDADEIADGVARQVAQNLPAFLAGNSRDDDDDEDADDDDRDDGRSQTRGVRVYRLDRKDKEKNKDKQKHKRVRDDDDDEDGDATVQAHGRGTASLKVAGPITFRLRAQSGDVEFTGHDGNEVTVRVSDVPSDEVALSVYGDRVEPSFRGRKQLRRGRVRVELPRGSRIDLESMSGDVSVKGVTGELRLRTMSGDVKLAGVGKVDLQTISGDVHLDGAQGPVRLHTVSGKGVISTVGPAPQLDFQSASGDLDWSGACGKECHVSVETVSGDLVFTLDDRSSFELSYSSHSGELRDGVSLNVKHAPRRKHGSTGGWLEATYGRGEGVIEADAFSGNLTLRKK